MFLSQPWKFTLHLLIEAHFFNAVNAYIFLKQLTKQADKENFKFSYLKQICLI